MPCNSSSRTQLQGQQSVTTHTDHRQVSVYDAAAWPEQPLYLPLILNVFGNHTLQELEACINAHQNIDQDWQDAQGMQRVFTPVKV